jgi:Gpi18-like mannosyltransferase
MNLVRQQRRSPFTSAVFVVASVCDAILIPLGYGSDFVAWDLASGATLNGSNIYAHHPAGYPTGPFAYPPLFLYLELPFQFLAHHFGVPFSVVGKLPIVIGDFVLAGLIGRHYLERGKDDREVAYSVALYLLNPLVLYNSAFYGRFDSVCLAFFMLALRLHDSQDRTRAGFPIAYAAAIATKIFPAFVALWFWWNEPKRRWQTFAIVSGVLIGLAFPYLITSPSPFLTDILLANIAQYPRGLSWQVLFLGALALNIVQEVSFGFLAVFLIAANNSVRSDLDRYCLRTLLLFVLLSKVVYEQYLVWVFPFLIIERRRHPAAALALLAGLSVGGMISNPHIHPFGEQIILVNVMLALCIVAYLWIDRGMPIVRSGKDPALQEPVRPSTRLRFF